MHTFSLLTIGDGLAAQIPALLISTATGIIVTRSAARPTSAPTSSTQFLGQPRAPMVAGGVVAAMGLVPGLPTLPFLVVGGALVLVGRSVTTRKRGRRPAGRPPRDRGGAPAGPADAAVGALAVDPLELAIGFGLLPLVDRAPAGRCSPASA